MRRRFFILLPLGLLFFSGCMTHKLWTESKLDSWNEPMPQPNLRLFQALNRSDVLVVYEEFSERSEVAQTRAFFLNENKKALAQHTRPHFVPTKLAAGLASAADEIHSNQLPVYNDGSGHWKKIAWTPVAVTLDASIIGGALGCLWIYSGGPGLGGGR